MTPAPPRPRSSESHDGAGCVFPTASRPKEGCTGGLMPARRHPPHPKERAGAEVRMPPPGGKDTQRPPSHRPRDDPRSPKGRERATGRSNPHKSEFPSTEQEVGGTGNRDRHRGRAHASAPGPIAERWTPPTVGCSTLQGAREDINTEHHSHAIAIVKGGVVEPATGVRFIPWSHKVSSTVRSRRTRPPRRLLGTRRESTKMGQHLGPCRQRANRLSFREEPNKRYEQQPRLVWTPARGRATTGTTQGAEQFPPTTNIARDASAWQGGTQQYE